MSFRKAFEGVVQQNGNTSHDNPATAPPLAIGTLQWGTTWIDEKLINSRGGCLPESTARDIVQHATKAGIQLWDTAEGYGGGTSEKRLGRLLAEHQQKADTATPDQIIVMTKFLPVAWRYSHGCFENAVRQSCQRLGVDCIPVYLLHSPIHWRSLEFWVEASAICKRKGLIEALGLSNCNAEQVERAVQAGNKYGVDVVLNQVHYSLLAYNSQALQRMQESCRKHGVIIVGFSPIGQGLLTDKLTEESFQTNRPAKMMKIEWDHLHDLRSTLLEIADKYEVTMARVALKWCIQHEVVPLVGCRSVSQLGDSMGCVDNTWQLTKEEMTKLDTVALNRSTFESPAWRRAIFVSLFGTIMVVCRALDLLGFGMMPSASA